MSSLTVTESSGEELLKLVYSPQWTELSSCTHIYVRYYLLPFDPQSDFFIPGIDGNEVEFCGNSFRIVVAELKQKEYASGIPWLVKRTEIGHEIAFEKIRRKLPDANYILVSTPMDDNVSNQDSYLSASCKVDELVGILRAFGGNNLFREQAYESAVDLVGNVGDEAIATKVVPVANACEGPFATADIWQQFDEVSKFLSLSTSSTRNRILISAKLIEQASNNRSSLKFFNYWVALEVAADTDKTAKIIRLLGTAYEKKDHSNAFIQNYLGFTALKDLRNSIFHSGIAYEMRPEVERYFQYLILDVIRARLQLPCLRFMEKAILAGFDVAWIGLNDAKVENFVIPQAE